MEQKELPQEVVNEIALEMRMRVEAAQSVSSRGYVDLIIQECAKVAAEKLVSNDAMASTQETYSSVQILNPADLMKVITAKDTTIKQQAEKIEKLTGLLKDEVTKENLNQDEEDRELLGLMIHDYENETERFLTPKQAADEKWQSYKEQRGI